MEYIFYGIAVIILFIYVIINEIDLYYRCKKSDELAMKERQRFYLSAHDPDDYN